ncbi:rubrerythrin family protein [Candidatus Falkowbacteria bacterium RIFCSPLOWO2_12_FULL_45_10]|uniref:Rubrerythrin family protein n=2 Tax=Candidatus Falkowiibacteriota TaxID=1752728 RepID=A0A1F5RZ84_9BACT|nr:MAG: rubrerythrin family protein [Candidatus Falkowbacteria bacterium RIFCSPHIGHO2_02_FULL_45_15]OGF19920.1 MAG: rubrerythrin family protein [Candidatus Falkowbacteria bacterium RIFCSPLOWO2_12_FULL_45_10]
MLTNHVKNLLLRFQKNEITEYYVYSRLSRLARGDNQEIIRKIADDEKRHYQMLYGHTQTAVKPSRWLMFKYTMLSRVFGLTFAIKLMEKGEEMAQATYERVKDSAPPIKVLLADEHRHEKDLVGMIEEERLNYMGSVVLGLNDALVELTGALAGLSFALQNTKLIALAGLITGIAASFSMAASEYLSTKSEGNKNSLKSALYTGLAYIVTVLFLIFPFLVLADYRWALAWTLINAIAVIAVFTYFSAVTKDLRFKKLFSEMFIISMGVAVFSFGISIVLKNIFNIEV